MKDLFEWYYDEPQEVIDIVNEMGETSCERGLGYEDLEHYNKRLIELGYEFEYGLSAEPFNLRKL